MDAAYRTLEAKHISTPAGEGVGVALLVLSLGVLSGWLTGAMRLASWGEGLTATTPLGLAQRHHAMRVTYH